ncbi:hypothetical protein [Methanocorpusculum vombati]|uniref:Uncharacterized protein n=1 Tax=Methanocorpusculum vombati TaxID=3002864 RepID=A0ABT4IKG6_9EURY|nr:hypothetical protein [Methanocorpusculum vombati]MCZ9319562.1 hypothetical protein [Methanocorpusculum sp.]MCZ0862252.1 hypothetical protein [Methanocorpusculum vombati]MDE2519731.1 hypothetical protein [Methanocorpusculum sp.]MDE2534488.1 hypothetical protein [Methanocorpusculum sp.]MDE2546136.1 hypothetical protein [Methanocorpusculum sp.]
MTDAELAYLANIDQNLRLLTAKLASTTEDISFQYPTPTEPTVELASGATYTRELNISKKLRRYTVSAPAGVIVSILKNDVPWRRHTNAFGTEDLPNGELFGKITIIAQNTTTYAVQWGCTLIFEP